MFKHRKTHVELLVEGFQIGFRAATFVAGRFLRKNPWLKTFIFFLGAGVAPMAEAQQGTDSLVQVRGQPGMVEVLHMGPDQTKFWLKLRQLIYNPEWIEDFGRIADLFSLTLTDPVDTITIRTKEIRMRYDAKDDHYFIIKSLIYGIAPDDQAPNRPVLRLSIEINGQQACITDQAATQVVGHGDIGVASHAGVPAEFFQDPTGVFYAEGFGGHGEPISRAPVSMSFFPSGCLNMIVFRRPLSQ